MYYLPEMKVQKWNHIISPPKLLPENAQYTLVSTQNHNRRPLFAKKVRARLLKVTQIDATVSSVSRDNLDISLQP